jgi:hypothetical protein
MKVFWSTAATLAQAQNPAAGIRTVHLASERYPRLLRVSKSATLK